MFRGLGKDVDHLLRGGYTQPRELSEGRLRIPVRRLVLAGLLLGAIYGLFMGLYAALRGGEGGVAQLLATTFKVPLLFLLTLAVTFPSLYVISTLAGSRLRLADTLRLVLAAVVVNLALLASLGPITGFFTLSTTSYSFMVILNVLFFALAGGVGLVFLSRALERLFASGPNPEVSGPEPEPDDAAAAEAQSDGSAPRAAAPLPRRVMPQPEGRGRAVLKIWLVVFGVVGAQMGWILRPFVGSPSAPFQLFRERDSNFFEALFQHLGNLFS